MSKTPFHGVQKMTVYLCETGEEPLLTIRNIKVSMGRYRQ